MDACKVLGMWNYKNVIAIYLKGKKLQEERIWVGDVGHKLGIHVKFEMPNSLCLNIINFMINSQRAAIGTSISYVKNDRVISHVSEAHMARNEGDLQPTAS